MQRALASFALGLSLLLPAFDTTAETIKGLKAAYKAKDGVEAVRLMDQLVSSFGEIPAKEQEDAVKAVEAAFSTRHDDGKEVDDLFVGAAASLASMGTGGGKALLRVIGLKHVRARPAVLATLVEGLGEQGDVGMLPELLKWLRPEKPLGIHAPVIAGAVRALVHYREADPKLRKQAVGELVAVYGDLDTRARAERAKQNADAEVESAFQQIETPMLLTLRTLSGANFENAPDWTHWWSKAKDDDWTRSAPDPAPPPKKGGPRIGPAGD